MIEDHIHHHFKSPAVSIGNKAVPFAVRTETRIYIVIVGGGVAVIAASGHIILKHGTYPYGCDTERINIVEMIADAAHVTTMTSIGIPAISHNGIIKIPDIDILIIQALGETVGHKQIEYVAGIKSLVFRRGPVACLKLIWDRSFLAIYNITEIYLTRLCIRRYRKIYEFVIFRIERNLTVQLHAGIIHREIGRSYIRSRKHKLQGVIGHAYPPERRLDVRDIAWSFGTKSGCRSRQKS